MPNKVRAGARVRSFIIDDATFQRVNLAAASLGGMSCSEYVRRAIACVLQADAMSNPALAAAFAYENQRAAEASRELEPA